MNCDVTLRSFVGVSSSSYTIAGVEQFAKWTRETWALTLYFGTLNPSLKAKEVSSIVFYPLTPFDSRNKGIQAQTAKQNSEENDREGDAMEE